MYEHEKVFLKLDAVGAGGWSCVSPDQNPLLYDWTQNVDVRVAYLIDYIQKNVLAQVGQNGYPYFHRKFA